MSGAAAQQRKAEKKPSKPKGSSAGSKKVAKRPPPRLARRGNCEKKNSCVVKNSPTPTDQEKNNVRSESPPASDEPATKPKGARRPTGFRPMEYSAMALLPNDAQAAPAKKGAIEVQAEYSMITLCPQEGAKKTPPTSDGNNSLQTCRDIAPATKNRKTVPSKEPIDWSSINMERERDAPADVPNKYAFNVLYISPRTCVIDGTKYTQEEICKQLCELAIVPTARGPKKKEPYLPDNYDRY